MIASFPPFAFINQQTSQTPSHATYPSLPPHLLPPQRPYAQQNPAHQRCEAQASQQHASSGTTEAAVANNASSTGFQAGGAKMPSSAPSVKHEPSDAINAIATSSQASKHPPGQTPQAVASGAMQPGNAHRHLLSAFWQLRPHAGNQLDSPQGCHQTLQKGSLRNPQQGSLVQRQPQQLPKSNGKPQRLADSSDSLDTEHAEPTPPPVTAQPQQPHATDRDSQEGPHSQQQIAVADKHQEAAAQEENHGDARQQDFGPSIDSLKASNSWLPASKPLPVADEGQRAATVGYPILIQ